MCLCGQCRVAGACMCIHNDGKCNESVGACCAFVIVGDGRYTAEGYMHADAE